MSILRDVLAELFGMFVADARLTAAILAVVVLVALMIEAGGVAPLLAGAVLLTGCLCVLVVAVMAAARKR